MSLSHEFWFWLIIVLLSFNYIFSNILEYLNDKNWNTKIPNSLKNFYKKMIMSWQKNIKLKKVNCHLFLTHLIFF